VRKVLSDPFIMILIPIDKACQHTIYARCAPTSPRVHRTGILITTDMDFSSFGPWYCNSEADKEFFQATVRKILALLVRDGLVEESERCFRLSG